MCLVFSSDEAKGERCGLGGLSQEVVLLIPHRQDSVVVALRGYCSVYVGHLKSSLTFLLFRPLVEILSFYDIPLSQLNPNATRVVVAFDVRCRSLGMESSLNLFLFVLFHKNQ